MPDNILQNSIKFHKVLNPILWHDNHLNSLIRKHLLKIANNFIDFIDYDDIEIEDITISGSNAAYTYTKNSDIDLHILIKVPEDQEKFLREYMDAKKALFNLTHSIHIKEYPVEVYVQFTDQPHVSSGVYSVTHDEWIVKPSRSKAAMDHSEVIHKLADFVTIIGEAAKTKDIDTINKVWKKLSDYLKEGLQKTGEFGTANLVFKVLRNAGIIDLLAKYKLMISDKELSIQEGKR
jgi:hypothetical protein